MKSVDTTKMMTRPGVGRAGHNQTATRPPPVKDAGTLAITAIHNVETHRRHTMPLAMSTELRRVLGRIPSLSMRPLKRLLIALGGIAVLALGVAMIVLPGPAFLVIPAGLAILALEFAWARKALRSARAVVPRRFGRDLSPRRISVRLRQKLDKILLVKVRRIFLRKKRFA